MTSSAFLPNSNTTSSSSGSGTNTTEDDENVLLVMDPEMTTVSSMTVPPSLESTEDTTSTTGSTSHDDDMMREGTLMSARMNLLTSMVGGGSLSLPLAFHQAGNAVIAPISMIVIAVSMEASIQCLIASGLAVAGTTTRKKGTVTLEQVACAAFGPMAKYGTMALVFFICFFTLVGYGVLLRDLLQPLTDTLLGPSANNNTFMFAVVLLITPLTTLSSLTALKHIGAFSMMSVFVMACCVSYRAIQCNASSDHTHGNNHNKSWNVTILPHSIQDVLQSLPILISVYVCQFNVLPVHNELRNPTPKRIQSFVRSTYAICTIFYIALGFLGSLYNNCLLSTSNKLQSNILKNFPDSDPIIFFGRVCLTLTIAFAFPVLVLPARNVILNTTNTTTEQQQLQQQQQVSSFVQDAAIQNDLHEKLLPPQATSTTTVKKDCIWKRRLISIAITWIATAIASCVSSIAVVWDFLGSSLSILLAFVLPCGSYLMLVSKENKTIYLRIMSILIISLSIPIMIIGTSNAFYTTFIRKQL